MFKSTITNKEYFSKEAMLADESAYTKMKHCEADKKAEESKKCCCTKKNDESTAVSTREQEYNKISEVQLNIDKAIDEKKEAVKLANRYADELSERKSNIYKEAELEVKELDKEYRDKIDKIYEAADSKIDKLKKQKRDLVRDYLNKYGEYKESSTKSSDFAGDWFDAMQYIFDEFFK